MEPDISRLALSPNLHNIPNEIILEIFNEDVLTKQDLYNARLVHRNISRVLGSPFFQEVTLRWGAHSSGETDTSNWQSSPSVLFSSGRRAAEEEEQFRERVTTHESLHFVRRLSLHIRGGDGPLSVGFPTSKFAAFVQVFQDIGIEAFGSLTSIDIDVSLRSPNMAESLASFLQTILCCDQISDLGITMSHYPDADCEFSENGHACLENIPVHALRRLAITADHGIDDGRYDGSNVQGLSERDEPSSDSVALLSVETFYYQTFQALANILRTAPKLEAMSVQSKRYKSPSIDSSYRWELLESVLDSINADDTSGPRLERLELAGAYGLPSSSNLGKLSSLKSVVMSENELFYARYFIPKSEALLESQVAVESLAVPHLDDNILQYLKLPQTTTSLKRLEINLQMPIRPSSLHVCLATEFYESALPGLRENLTDLSILPWTDHKRHPFFGYDTPSEWVAAEQMIWPWTLKTAAKEGIDWTSLPKLSSMSGFILGNNPFGTGIASFVRCDQLESIKVLQIVKRENVPHKNWMGGVEKWTAEEDCLLQEGLRLEIHLMVLDTPDDYDSDMSVSSDRTRRYLYKNRRFHNLAPEDVAPKCLSPKGVPPDKLSPDAH